MIDAYNDIRAGNCQKCGSKRYLGMFIFFRSLPIPDSTQMDVKSP